MGSRKKYFFGLMYALEWTCEFVFTIILHEYIPNHMLLTIILGLKRIRFTWKIHFWGRQYMRLNFTQQIVPHVFVYYLTKLNTIPQRGFLCSKKRSSSIKCQSHKLRKYLCMSRWRMVWWRQKRPKRRKKDFAESEWMRVIVLKGSVVARSSTTFLCPKPF